jgi:hypothetical protein
VRSGGVVQAGDLAVEHRLAVSPNGLADRIALYSPLNQRTHHGLVMMNSVDAVKNVNWARDLAIRSQEADGEEFTMCVDRRPSGHGSGWTDLLGLPFNGVSTFWEDSLIVISPRYWDAQIAGGSKP